MSKKVLIVGGVAGGAGTAARLRRMDETAEIIMFERGKYISFANCGLPYYIGGTIKDRDALLLQTPEDFNARFNVEVRTQNEVKSIDKENKKVTVMDLSRNVKYEESYDVLVLSPGSTPIKPKISGIDAPNIFSLWNIPDTDTIKSFIEKNELRTATVIGAGFIGIEMAENLYDLGLKVSIAEMADQVMTPVDMDMAQILHQHLASKGIDLHLNNGVKEFVQNGKVTQVVLNDGTMIASDIVILSIGIIPNGELAKNAGLDTNKKGGIVVDQFLRTKDENIYALGDAIEVIDFNTKGKIMVPLAGPANKQARIVANNICGASEPYNGTQGTSIAKVFDLTVASTGLNEKSLQKEGKVYGKDYHIAYALPKSHAGYYPGAFPLTLKLVFDQVGKVLGAQIVGIEGVDKRIDVIATAIRFNGHVQDLTELELAYAPPYSSAKDPVNMVAFVADNILSGAMKPILPREIKDLDMDNTIIVDVREPEERELGFIENSIIIPVDSLRNNLAQLDKDKEIVIYCAVGLRGHVASRLLAQKGYRVKNLLGGYTLYKTCVANYTGASGNAKEISSSDDKDSPRQG
jgi:NADPH-dependent 2,4-dienoyl-CoA reductase/sulfur reductase-like enzyme/rhodanese-related sulfurtransferase